MASRCWSVVINLPIPKSLTVAPSLKTYFSIPLAASSLLKPLIKLVLLGILLGQLNHAIGAKPLDEPLRALLPCGQRKGADLLHALDQFARLLNLADEVHVTKIVVKFGFQIPLLARGEMLENGVVG